MEQFGNNNQQTADKPVVYIIAGPNGAGKTTFAFDYLPKIASCYEYANTDEIAKGLSPLDATAAEFAAGRIFYEKIASCIAERRNFAFETTLAARTFLKRIREWKQAGWQILLFYLYLPSAEFSRSRVKLRVEQGGHDVADADIVRRYPKSVCALFDYMEECDATFCFDGSLPTAMPIFKKDDDGLTIYDQDKYNQIRSFVENDGN